MAARLACSYIIATATLLVIAGVFVYWGLLGSLRRQDERMLESKTRVLRTLLQDPAQAQALESEIEHEAGEDQALKYYIRILDAQGRASHATPLMDELAPREIFPESDVVRAIVEYRHPRDRDFLLLAAHANSGTDHRERRTVQIALDTSMNREILAEYRRRLILVFVGGSFFAGFASIFVTRDGLRPLREITAATEYVSASSLATRLDAATWPRELQDLAGAFDQMLDRLQASFDRLNAFAADLAHALRNPLNNLRGEAEVTLTCGVGPDEFRQTLISSLEEYERLSRLIESLLFLARADNPQNALERVKVSAAVEMAAVREFYEALAAEKDIAVTCSGSAEITGSPILIRRAISNLLGNAVKHTGAGGSIRLTARTGERGDVEIEVADTGDGIAAEHLPRVFERFFQAEGAPSGSVQGAGLGLAIVRSIMQLHGGTASIHSIQKKGTTVTLRFPSHPLLPAAA